jgi:hypothetical protein
LSPLIYKILEVVNKILARFAIQTLGKLGRRRERARELSEAGSGKVFLSDKGEVMM